MANDTPAWPPPPSSYGGPNENSNFNSSGTPPRHGCLTAWLVFALIAHSATILLYSLAYPLIHRGLPTVTPLVAALLVVAGVASIISILALFQWRRWGVYGIVATSLLTFGLNLVIGVGVTRSISGLIGIAVLYWVLNIGGQSSAWRYLK